MLLLATFEAGFVEEGLIKAFSEAGVRCEVSRGPYGQVVEILADRTSETWTKTFTATTLVVRLEDAFRIESGTSVVYDPARSEIATSWIRALFDQLSSLPAGSSPSVLFLLTPSPGQRIPAAITQWIEDWAGRLTEQAHATGVFVNRRSVTGDDYLPYLDAVAHIPLRREVLREVGAALAADIIRAWSRPIKILAVDCDNTLWGGSCAELGPEGVDVEDAWDRFQNSLLRHQRAGLLIALVSHNQRADVMAVLDSGRMALRREHLVADRVDWRPKSQLVTEIADELGLGLEAVLFLDDNPLERSEVAAALPAVTVLELPTDHRLWPDMLETATGLREASTTEVDRRRTLLYQEEQARRAVREQFDTHREFVESLNVNVSFIPLSYRSLDRAAQLCDRTNQFRTSRARLSRSDLALVAKQAHSQVWTISVEDRLGDYGTVGVVVTETEDKVLRLVLLVLSCRVLGRNVEEAISQHLDWVAREHNCLKIEIDLDVTDRNQPAQRWVATRADEVLPRPGGSVNIRYMYRKSSEGAPDSFKGAGHCDPTP